MYAYICRFCIVLFLSQTDANQVCSVVLDILSNIYHQDAANYFILEPQNTLAQFAEKIFSKSLDVQVRELCCKIV